MPNTKNEQGTKYATLIFAAFVPIFGSVLKTHQYIIPPKRLPFTVRLKQSIKNSLKGRKSRKYFFYDQFFERLDRLPYSSALSFSEKASAICSIEADLKEIFTLTKFPEGYPKNIKYYIDLLALMRAMFHLSDFVDKKQGEEKAWKEFSSCLTIFTQSIYQFPEENLQKTIFPYLQSLYCALFSKENAFLKTKPIAIIRELLALDFAASTLWINYRNLHDYDRPLQYTPLFEPYHTMSLEPILEKIRDRVKEHLLDFNLPAQAVRVNLTQVICLLRHVESKFENILKFPQIIDCVNKLKITIELARIVSEVKYCQGVPDSLKIQSLPEKNKRLFSDFCQKILNDNSYAKSIMEEMPRNLCNWLVEHKPKGDISLGQIIGYICFTMELSPASARTNVTAYASDSDNSTKTLSDINRAASLRSSSTEISSNFKVKQKPVKPLTTIEEKTLQAYLVEKKRKIEWQIIKISDQISSLEDRHYDAEADALATLKKFIEKEVEDFFDGQARKLAAKETDVKEYIDNFKKTFSEKIETPIKKEMDEAIYFQGKYQEYRTKIQERDKQAGKEVKNTMTLTEHRDPEAKRIIKQIFGNILLLLGTLVVGYVVACIVKRGFFFTKTKTQSVLNETRSVIGTAEKQTKGLTDIHNRVYW